MADHALEVRLAEASSKKYSYAPAPAEYQKTRGMYVFHPRMALAWKNFPKDATRWEFEDRGDSPT